jgi:hypothetical protein
MVLTVVAVCVCRLSTVLVLRFFASSETAVESHIYRGFFQLADIGITDNRAHQRLIGRGENLTLERCRLRLFWQLDAWLNQIGAISGITGNFTSSSFFSSSSSASPVPGAVAAGVSLATASISALPHAGISSSPSPVPAMPGREADFAQG